MKKKKRKTYVSKYRSEHELSLVQMAGITGWSYGTVWNVLNNEDRDYEKDYNLLMLKIEAYLEKRKK